MNITLKIAIAETSQIIRNGLEAVLKHLPGISVHLVDICAEEMLLEAVQMHHPDILVVDPLLLGFGNDLAKLKNDSGCPNLKCIALVHTLVPESILSIYDEQISIYHTSEEIKKKLEKLVEVPVEDEEADENGDQQLLSAREKEIVICVVKGMTNREIADQLYLSAHTVITHRRNIARKLRIHTPSGLTIYAIVNKLVELKDIQKGEG